MAAGPAEPRLADDGGLAATGAAPVGAFPPAEVGAAEDELAGLPFGAAPVAGAAKPPRLWSGASAAAAFGTRRALVRTDHRAVPEGERPGQPSVRVAGLAQAGLLALVLLRVPGRPWHAPVAGALAIRPAGDWRATCESKGVW